MVPHWTQARSCPPQRLPDLVFQQSSTGTSGRAAEFFGGSWELGADIAPSTHTEG